MTTLEERRYNLLNQLLVAVREWIDAGDNYHKLGTSESYAQVRITCYNILKVVEDIDRLVSETNKMIDKFERCLEEYVK